MRFLIVAEIHHPEILRQAIDSAPASAPPLFPPSQSEYLWTRALRKLGHEVSAFIRNKPAVFGPNPKKSHSFTGAKSLDMVYNVLSNRLPRLQPDYRLRNRRFVESVRRIEPDVIVLVGGNQVIYPETLAEIKRDFGTKLVYMTGVSPIVFSHAIERQAAPLYDLVLVNDFYHGIQWLELGAKRMEAMPVSACDPDYHHPYTPTDADRCDVGFVGTLIPDNLYSTRIEALNAIRDCGLGVWSIHGIPPTLQANYRGPALGETMLRILCGSKIQVNPHGNFMRYGGNMRLFEAAACGVFQIADDLPGVSKWFTPGENIATFRDPAHLRQQVAYYLAHDAEREQIAAAARAHVYAHHTYDHRMAALIDLIK